jgi:D-arabinose 1-dehydrogenase-like Zn-dependent alcohol dehydrogenase
LIHVLSSLVHSNLANLFRASRAEFEMPYPVIPGSFAVGRIAAVGPDAVSLKPDQLVLVGSFVRARDDPSVSVVWGVMAGSTPEQQRLYKSLGLNGMFATHVLAPLENVYAVDEAQFFGGGPSTGLGLGYEMPHLLMLSADAIAYAGIRRIGLEAGERVIVTPATGHYSRAAVDVAVALGARVIAASRNAAGLAKLKNAYPGAVETVQLTGDVSVDGKALAAFGRVDAVVDVSPPAASGATNLAAAVSALGESGRISLIGVRDDKTLPVPYMQAMFKNWTIKGSLMYERKDMERVIRLAEAGLLKLGKSAGHEIMGVYGLDQLTEAIDKAVEKAGPGCIVHIKP